MCLCGRATWKDGIPVYAKQGVKALEDWLGTEGVKNIEAVNAAIKPAKPWYAKAGVTVSGPGVNGECVAHALVRAAFTLV